MQNQLIRRFKTDFLTSLKRKSTLYNGAFNYLTKQKSFPFSSLVKKYTIGPSWKHRINLLTDKSQRARAIGLTSTMIMGSYCYLSYDKEKYEHIEMGIMGIQRQATFWNCLIPVIWDYYWNFSSSSPLVRYQTWSRLRSHNNNTLDVHEGQDQDHDRYYYTRQDLLKASHERHASKVLQIMRDLKGLYIKLGQVLSVTMLPVPDPFRVAFRTLQSDVPGWQDYDTVIKPFLEKEFSDILSSSSSPLSLDELFISIDKVPCGAASIGQAHRATLRLDRMPGNKRSQHETDDAEVDVILKVQYPDAKWQIPADITCVRNVLRLCVWAGLVDKHAAQVYFDEFSRQFLAELDFDAERQNLKEIYHSSLVSTSPYAVHKVIVPKPYDTLCTSRVITMTYLPGRKLEEEARRRLAIMGIDTSKGSIQVLRDATKEYSGTKSDGSTSSQKSMDNHDSMFETSSTRAPNDELVVQPQGSWLMKIPQWIGMYCLGVDNLLWSIRLAQRIYLSFTVALVGAIKTISPTLPVPSSWESWAEENQKLSQQSRLWSQTESWIDALFDVHGHQIFELGLFNADPHPGNILILDDDQDTTDTKQYSQSQIGLIDFGQCKRITLEEQVLVARLIVAVAQADSDEIIANAFRDLGIQTQNNSTEFLANFARLLFGSIQPYHLSHAWHANLHKMDRIVYFPKELSMIYRASLLLRGLALSLQSNVSISEKWYHHAQAAIQRNSDRMTVSSTNPSIANHTKDNDLVTSIHTKLGGAVVMEQEQHMNQIDLSPI
jgi:aarF domain-containing kinase